MCATQTKGRMTGPEYWRTEGPARYATKLLEREARAKHLQAQRLGPDATAKFAKEWRGLVRTRRDGLDVLF